MRRCRKILASLLSLTLLITSLPTTILANQVGSEASIVQNLEEQNNTLDNVPTTTPPAIDLKSGKYIGEGYEVEFRVTSKWGGTFGGELKLTNTSNKPLENWTLKFDLEHEIKNMWNAKIITHEDKSYIIKNEDWNQDIAPGSSINIGFEAAWSEDIKFPESYELLVAKQDVKNEDYTIDFKVTSDWGQAFNGEISITNNTKETIEDWSLEFDFDRNIKSFWEAEIVEHKDNHYVIKNRGYNANIAPGQTIRLGFGGNPGNVKDKPVGYKLIQCIQETMDKWGMDTDNDYLPDFLEEKLGTDPLKADTDGDGLPDGYEYLVLGTDPLKVDTDENGICDGDEDFDGDGLTNLQEYQLGTNPFKADTDGDGLNDYDEVNKYHTDPLLYDTDGDGVSDGDEIVLGLDPLNSYTHEGILDSEYLIEQSLQEEDLKNINKDNNVYQLEMDIVAAGNAKNNLINNESDISSVLSDNRAIVGKVISLNYDGKKVESAKLEFTLDEDYLSNNKSIFPDEEIFQTIERYQVFKFDKALGILYPIETIHDIENHSLTAKVTELGDYCLIDMEKWLYDLGMLNYKEEKNAYHISKTFPIQQSEIDKDNIRIGSNREGNSNQIKGYDDITFEELEKILRDDIPRNNTLIEEELISSDKKTNINQQADLVFVIDTTGSMGGAIANVKANIASVIQYLRTQNITLHVAFIDYQDITYDGIDSTKIHQLNGHTWLHSTKDMLNILSGIRLGDGGDTPETPIDALGFAEKLTYRNSAYKFVVLVTDAGYKINNTHGIESLNEIALKLKEKGIFTSVVGSYYNYKELYNITEGIGIDFNNFSINLQKYIDEIMNKNKTQVYIDGLDLTTGTLAAKLKKGSLIDTDGDGIPDCDEVNWDYVKEDSGKSILITLGELLKELKDTNISVFDRFKKILSNTPDGILKELRLTSNVTENYNKLLQQNVLMPSEKGSALKRDSDGDGYIDYDDPQPILIKDDPKFLDGLKYGIKNSIYNTYFEHKPDPTEYFVFQAMSTDNSSQKFNFKWNGKGYTISETANANRVFTLGKDANGKSLISVEAKNDAKNQSWLIIPNKDKDTYSIKCLVADKPYGGLYVDAQKKGYVTLADYKDNSKFNMVFNNLDNDWITFEEARLQIEKWTAKKEILKAYNCYMDNVKELNKVKNNFNNGKTIINGQNSNTYNSFKLGDYSVGHNGCEVIATYNAFVLNNMNPDFLKLLFEFEVNALYIKNGYFGSKPKTISKCLNSYNVTYIQSKNISALQKALDEGKTVIYSAWNDIRWKNIPVVKMNEGLHTMALIYSPSYNKICVYNRTSTRPDAFTIDKFEELANKQGETIAAYILQ